ncbi:MAG TPA: UbiH/UbiF family hydroxylase [Xanthobacteraceae bacterium]|jgi:2-octaprenyl-6-methoxyphenol hydroxylase
MQNSMTSEVAVVGGGPSGLVAALMLSAAGIDTVLIAPRPAAPDRRTTALLGSSVEILEAIGVWPSLAERAAPLERLRLVDATRRLLRAPETIFSAAELGLPAFGYNIENVHLHDALRAAVSAASNVRVHEEPIVAVEPDAIGVTLRLASGAVARARLVIAADGRNSICREAAGIEVEMRELPQTALALNLRHSRPHGNVSTEFHTESGPFTLVSLPGNRSSLVCVVEPDEADALMALDGAALSLEIERRAHSILGCMEVEDTRAAFPLGFSIAESFAARRVALVGEAGHVLPPIGAQGLNLGIRDAAAIAELIAEERRNGEDPGGDALLASYDKRRRSDVRSRALAVDWMNRSLLSDFLPLQLAKGFGLHLAARVGVLRRFLMRQGMGPDINLPRVER